jgi:murein DD-endopeptidase MepM/ murein hydrolase activator NlpD
MIKLFYISKTNQKLNEFKYLSIKSLLTYVFILFFIVGITWSSIKLLDYFTSSAKNITALEIENKTLREKFKLLSSNYKSLNADFENLRKETNYLRLVANLPTLEADEYTIGVGGSEFEKLNRNIVGSIRDINELSQFVEKLTVSLKFEMLEHQKIAGRLKENKILHAAMPAILPSKGVIGLSGFGMRDHPILGFEKMHEGIDIITEIGTNVRASGDGIISFVGNRGGYGLTVEINHAGGYKTVYAHLSKSLVKEGQKVSRGKVIALTGNSGLSTGPHLHYEVHQDGIKLDPSQFFFDDLALFEQKSKK